MSNLTTYKFAKLYDFSSGISTKPEQAGHGSPFVSFSTVFNNYFLPKELNDLMDTSEKEQETYSIKKGDILLTRTSETVDELAMSCVAIQDYPKTTYSGFVKRLRPLQDNITYSKYMGFYLRSKLFRKTMTNNAVLTLRASLNEQIFSYLDLLLPSYKEQVKIGDLLHLLNQKIELNNKINKELESMAKTLYDYWFVQFDFPDENGKPYKSSGGKMIYNKKLKREIPEGWEDTTIKEVSNVIMGQSPKSEFYNQNFEGLPLLNGAADYENGSLNPKTYTTSYSRICQKDDMVFCIRATIGNLVFAEKEFCLGRGVAAVRAIEKEMSEILFYTLLNEIERFKIHASGSIIKGITKDDLRDALVVIPRKDIKDKFHKIVCPIFSKIRLNKKENQKLKELRDWLLPMLMNGQVSIKDSEYINNLEKELKVAETKPKYN